MKFTSILLCAALLLLLFAGCTTTPNAETVSKGSAAADDAAQIALEEQMVTAFYPCMDTQNIMVPGIWTTGLKKCVNMV